MCMKGNVVSRETGFPARLQLIENGKGSVLALSGRLLLSHDVYDGKAVEYERGVPAPPNGSVRYSLHRGYILVSGRTVPGDGGRLPGRTATNGNSGDLFFCEGMIPQIATPAESDPIANRRSRLRGWYSCCGSRKTELSYFSSRAWLYPPLQRILP